MSHTIENDSQHRNSAPQPSCFYANSVVLILQGASVARHVSRFDILGQIRSTPTQPESSLPHSLLAPIFVASFAVLRWDNIRRIRKDGRLFLYDNALANDDYTKLTCRQLGILFCLRLNRASPADIRFCGISMRSSWLSSCGLTSYPEGCLRMSERLIMPAHS